MKLVVCVGVCVCCVCCACVFVGAWERRGEYAFSSVLCKCAVIVKNKGEREQKKGKQRLPTRKYTKKEEWQERREREREREREKTF